MSSTKDNERNRQRDKSANSSYEPTAPSRYNYNGVQESGERKTQTTKKMKSDANPEKTSNTKDPLNVPPHNSEMSNNKGGYSKSTANYLPPSVLPDTPSRLKEVIKNKSPQKSKKDGLPPSFPNEASAQRMEVHRITKSPTKVPESNPKSIRSKEMSPQKKADSKEKRDLSLNRKKHPPPSVPKDIQTQAKKEGIKEKNVQSQSKKKHLLPSVPTDIQSHVKKAEGKEKSAQAQSKSKYLPPSILTDVPSQEKEILENKGSKGRSTKNYPPPSFPSEKLQQTKSVSRDTGGHSGETKSNKGHSYPKDISPNTKNVPKDKSQESSVKLHLSAARKQSEAAEAAKDQQQKTKSVILNTSLVEKIQKENIQATTEFLNTEISKRKEQAKKIQEMAKCVLDKSKTDNALASKSSTSLTNIEPTSSNRKSGSPHTITAVKSSESIKSRSVSEPRKKKSVADVKMAEEPSLRNVREKDIRARPSQETIVKNGSESEIGNNRRKEKKEDLPTTKVKSENSIAKLPTVPSSERVLWEGDQGDTNNLTSTKAKENAAAKKHSQTRMENQKLHILDASPERKKKLDYERKSETKIKTPEIIVNNVTVTQRSPSATRISESFTKKDKLHADLNKSPRRKDKSEIEIEGRKLPHPCSSPKQVLDKKVESQANKKRSEMTIANSTVIGPSLLDTLNMLNITGDFQDSLSRKGSTQHNDVQSHSGSAEKQIMSDKKNRSPPRAKHRKDDDRLLAESVPSVSPISDISLQEEEGLSPATEKPKNEKSQAGNSELISTECASPKRTKLYEETPVLSQSKEKMYTTNNDTNSVRASNSKSCIELNEGKSPAVHGCFSGNEEDEMHKIRYSPDHRNYRGKEYSTAQIIDQQFEITGKKPVLTLGDFQMRYDINESPVKYDDARVVIPGEKGIVSPPVLSSVCCNDYSSYRTDRQHHLEAKGCHKLLSSPCGIRSSQSRSEIHEKTTGSSYTQPFSIRVVGTDTMAAKSGKEKEKEKEKEREKEPKKKKKKKSENSLKASKSRSTTVCSVKSEGDVRNKRRSRSEESVGDNSKPRRCTPRCEDRRCPGRDGKGGDGGFGGVGDKNGHPFCRQGDSVNGWFGRISSAIGCQLQHIAGTKGIFKPPCCTGFYRLDNSTTGWLESVCPDEASSCSESTTACAQRKEDKKRKKNKKDDDDTDSQIETMPHEESGLEEDRKLTKTSQRSTKREGSARSGSKERREGSGKKSNDTGMKRSTVKSKQEDRESLGDGDERRRSSLQTQQDKGSSKDSRKSSLRKSIEDPNIRETIRESQKSSFRESYELETDEKDKTRDEEEDDESENNLRKSSTRATEKMEGDQRRSSIRKTQEMDDEDRESDAKRRSSIQVSQNMDDDRESDAKRGSSIKVSQQIDDERESDAKRRSSIKVSQQIDDERESDAKRRSSIKVSQQMDDERESDAKRRSSIKVSQQIDDDRESDAKRRSSIRMSQQMDDRKESDTKRRSSIQMSQDTDDRKESDTKRRSSIQVSQQMDNEEEKDDARLSGDGASQIVQSERESGDQRRSSVRETQQIETGDEAESIRKSSIRTKPSESERESDATCKVSIRSMQPTCDNLSLSQQSECKRDADARSSLQSERGQHDDTRRSSIQTTQPFESDKESVVRQRSSIRTPQHVEGSIEQDYTHKSSTQTTQPFESDRESDARRKLSIQTTQQTEGDEERDSSYLPSTRKTSQNETDEVSDHPRRSSVRKQSSILSEEKTLKDVESEQSEMQRKESYVRTPKTVSTKSSLKTTNEEDDARKSSLKTSGDKIGSTGRITTDTGYPCPSECSQPLTKTSRYSSALSETCPGVCHGSEMAASSEFKRKSQPASRQESLRQTDDSLRSGSFRQSHDDVSSRCATECLASGKQSHGSFYSGSHRSSRSKCGQQSCGTLPSESIKQSYSTLPPGSIKQSYETMPPESIKQSYGPLPSESARQSYSTHPPQSVKQSYSTMPPGSIKQSYETMPPESIKQSYGTLPSESARQSYSTHPPQSVKQSYSTMPPGSIKQSYGSLPPEHVRQSYGSHPPGSAKQSYGTHPHGSVRQSYGTLPPESVKHSYDSGYIKQPCSAASPTPGYETGSHSDHTVISQSKYSGDNAYVREIKSERLSGPRQSERKYFGSPLTSSSSRSPCSRLAPDLGEQQPSMYGQMHPNTFLESISGGESRVGSPPRTHSTSPDMYEHEQAYTKRFTHGSKYDCHPSRLQKDSKPYFRHHSAEHSTSVSAFDDVSPTRKSDYLRRLEKCRKSGMDRCHYPQYHDSIPPDPDEARWLESMLRNCKADETSFATTISVPRKTYPKSCMVQNKQSRLIRESPHNERIMCRDSRTKPKYYKRSASFSRYSCHLSNLDDSEMSRSRQGSKMSDYSTRDKYDITSQGSGSMTSTECMEESNVLYSRLSTEESETEEQTRTESSEMHKHEDTESPSDATITCRDHADSSSASSDSDESETERCGPDYDSRADCTSDCLEQGDSEYKQTQPKIKGKIIIRKPSKLKNTEICLQNMKVKMECHSYEQVSPRTAHRNVGSRRSDGHQFEARDRTSNRRKNPESDSDKGASSSNQCILVPEMKRSNHPQYKNASRMKECKTLTMSQKVIDLPRESSGSKLSTQQGKLTIPTQHLERLRMRLLPEQKIDCFQQIITPEQPTSICPGEQNKSSLGYFEESEGCANPNSRKESNFYSSDVATSITASQVQTEYDEVYSFGKSLLDDDMVYMRKPIPQSNASMFSKDESSLFDTEFDDITSSHSIAVWSKDKNASSSGNNNQSSSADHEESEQGHVYYSNGIKEAIKTFNANLLSLSKNEPMTETVDLDHIRLIQDIGQPEKDMFSIGDFIDPSAVNKDDPKIVFEKIRENSFRALMYASTMANLPPVKTFHLSCADFTSHDKSSNIPSPNYVIEEVNDKHIESTILMPDKKDVGVQVNIPKSLLNLRITTCEIHSYTIKSDKQYCLHSTTFPVKTEQKTHCETQDDEVSSIASILVNSIVHNKSNEIYGKKSTAIENTYHSNALVSNKDIYHLQFDGIETSSEFNSDTTSKEESTNDIADFRHQENNVTNITYGETLIIKNQSFQESVLSPIDFSFESIVESVESDVECKDNSLGNSFRVEAMCDDQCALEQSNGMKEIDHDHHGNLCNIFYQAGDMNAPAYKGDQPPGKARRRRNCRFPLKYSTTQPKETSDQMPFNPSQFVKECLKREIEKAIDKVYYETCNTMSNNSREDGCNVARSNNAIQFSTADCDLLNVDKSGCPKEEKPEVNAALNEESLLDWVKTKLSQEIGKLVSRFDWSAISKGNTLEKKSSLKGSSVDFCNTGLFNSQCPKIQFQGVPSSSDSCGGCSDYDERCQDRISNMKLYPLKSNPGSYKRCSSCYQKRKTTCCHYNSNDSEPNDNFDKSYDQILNEIRSYKSGNLVAKSNTNKVFTQKFDICEPNNTACYSKQQGDHPSSQKYTWDVERNYCEETKKESSVDSECYQPFMKFNRCPMNSDNIHKNTETDSSVDLKCYEKLINSRLFERTRNRENQAENIRTESSVDSKCYQTPMNIYSLNYCSMNAGNGTENSQSESSVDRFSLIGDTNYRNVRKIPSPIPDVLYEHHISGKSQSHTVLSAMTSDTNIVSPACCHSTGSLPRARKSSHLKCDFQATPIYSDSEGCHMTDTRAPFVPFLPNTSRGLKDANTPVRKANSALCQQQEFKSSFMRKVKPHCKSWTNEIYESLNSMNDPAEAFVTMYLSMASRSRSRRRGHNISRKTASDNSYYSGTNAAYNFINSLTRKNEFRSSSIPNNRMKSHMSYNRSDPVNGDWGMTFLPHSDRNCNKFLSQATEQSREIEIGDSMSPNWSNSPYDKNQKSTLSHKNLTSNCGRSFYNRNWNQSANNGAYDSSPQESLSDSSVESDDGMIVDKVPFVNMCISDATSHRGINRSEAVLDLPSLCRNELIKKPGERLPFFSTLKHWKNREKKYHEPHSEPIYQTSHFRRRENEFSDFARKNLNSSGNIIHTLSRDELVNDDGDDNLDGSEEDFHSAEEDMASYPPRSSEVDVQKPRYLCPHNVADMCNHRHFSLADECSRMQLQDLCRNCSCLMKYCQGMKRELKSQYCKAPNICDGINNASQAMCFSNNRSEQEERNIAFPFYRTLSEKCRGQPKIFKMGGGVPHKCIPNTIKDFVNWYACDDEEEKDSNDMQAVSVSNKGVSQYLCSSKTERNENCQEITNGKEMSQSMKEDPTAHGDVQNTNYKTNKPNISTYDVDMERDDGDAVDASSSSYEDTDEEDCDLTSIENLGYRMLKGVIDSKLYGDKQPLKKSKTHINYRETMRRSRAPLRRHVSKLKRSRAISRFVHNDDDSFIRDKTHRVYHRGESHGDVSDSTSLEDIQVPQVDKGRVRFACDKNGEWAEVGRGSYGCVYLGLLDGEIEVAIKDFYESNSYDHVIHEARMLVYLQRTGITPKFYGLRRRFDTTKQPGEYCIIMEYFGDGKTLFNVLSEKIELTTAEWLDVLGQLVAGLRLIHRRNVLINDLKADNILIDLNSARKTIRYIDVGMATYKQGLTFQLPQNQMGKYNFLAPEVRDGLHTSKRSDIYSLGYMLDQIRRVAGETLNGLESLVTQCMREEPKKRPYIDEIVAKVHKFVKSTSVTRTVSEKNCILMSNSV